MAIYTAAMGAAHTWLFVIEGNSRLVFMPSLHIGRRCPGLRFENDSEGFADGGYHHHQSAACFGSGYASVRPNSFWDEWRYNSQSLKTAYFAALKSESPNRTIGCVLQWSVQQRLLERDVAGFTWFHLSRDATDLQIWKFDASVIQFCYQ